MTRHLLSVLAWLAIVAGIPGLLQAAGRPPARTFVVPIMNGAQEVPPRATRAHGFAVFNLHPNNQELFYVVVVARITNVVGGHIHAAPPGVNGPIIFGFYEAPAGGGPFNGVLAHGKVIRGQTELPPSLGATLDNAGRFDALIGLLRTRNATYVNVHTNDGV
ncbi:MAG: CHRD domain-containing protein, partial [Planctomycetes bacterium]|nr:CHRD domain-containing protein [Planctomycetota bacterium]